MEMEAGPLKSPPESPFSKISPSQPSPVAMKFAPTLLLAAAATAAVLPHTTPSIAVHLAHVDNTLVRATITNTGAQALRLLQRGTILDPHPVRKVDVHTADGTTSPLLLSSFAGTTDRKLQGPGSRSTASTSACTSAPSTRAPSPPRSPRAPRWPCPSTSRARTTSPPPGGPLRLSASGSLPFASASDAEDAAVAGHVRFRSSGLELPRVDGARAAEARALFGRSPRRRLRRRAAVLRRGRRGWLRGPRLRGGPGRARRGRGQVRPPVSPALDRGGR